MEGKDVLALAMKIKLDKEVKEQSQKEVIQKRNESKDAFFRCKERCVCPSATCAVIKLKECSVCHNVLKSKCSKISCQGENGEKPTTLLTAAATVGSSSQRKLRLRIYSIYEESDESDAESEFLVESDLDDSEENGDAGIEESESEKSDKEEYDEMSEAI